MIRFPVMSKIKDAAAILGRRGGRNGTGAVKSHSEQIRAFWESPEGAALKERFRAERTGKPRGKR